MREPKGKIKNMKDLNNELMQKNSHVINIKELLKNHNKKILPFIGIREKWYNFYDK